MRKILTTLLLGASVAIITGSAIAHPTYVCKTVSEPITYDAVVIVDHDGKRCVVTLEDMSALPDDFTAPEVANGPWHTYDGGLSRRLRLLFPAFSGVVAGLRPPQSATGIVSDGCLTADFIGRRQRLKRPPDPLRPSPESTG